MQIYINKIKKYIENYSIDRYICISLDYDDSNVKYKTHFLYTSLYKRLYFPLWQALISNKRRQIWLHFTHKNTNGHKPLLPATIQKHMVNK